MDLCAVAYDQAVLTEDGAQRVNTRGGELQEGLLALLVRLASDERMRRAHILWDLGFGQVLGLKHFDAYLKGTDAVQGIMETPAWPQDFPDYLNHNVLVDGRVLEKVGMKELCRLCDITYGGEDSTFVPHDPVRAKTGLRWMRSQDGHRNRNIIPNRCRTERFAANEVGLDALEGISLYLQDKGVLTNHVMDLPGSVRADGRGDCAYLVLWGGGPELYWSWDDDPFPGCGSASRGE